MGIMPKAYVEGKCKKANVWTGTIFSGRWQNFSSEFAQEQNWFAAQCEWLASPIDSYLTEIRNTRFF
jgi:hypothetical protein